MKKITNRGRKILSMILRGISVPAASLVLQACYGMPDEQSLQISAKVRANETGEPIFGIKVSIDEGTEYWDYTNKGGYFYITVPIRDDYKIKLEDVDGPYNGGQFKEKTLPLKMENSYKDLLITMELVS
jgi:hypothetical protein